MLASVLHAIPSHVRNKSGPGTSSCKPVDTQLEQPCNVPAQRCHGAPHVAPGAWRASPIAEDLALHHGRDAAQQRLW